MLYYTILCYAITYYNLIYCAILYYTILCYITEEQVQVEAPDRASILVKS